MSHPEIIRLLSSCSHWIGEKLQDYKIEMTSSGYPRIWIPEDDDWYRLDAYIDYLENEEDPTENSSQSKEEPPESSSQSEEDNDQMEEEPTESSSQSEEDNDQVEDLRQYNFLPMLSIPSSKEFKVRTKHIEVQNVDFVPAVPLHLQQNKFLVARFIINKWERRDYQGDIAFNHSRFTEQNSYETLSFDDDEVTMNDIWEMVEDRLMVIMNCAARDRMFTFIKLYEMYSTNHTVSITHCYRDFLQYNKVEVKVDLYSNLPTFGTVIFASRIYRERGTMTPLGEYPTLQSLKKKYKTFKWKRVERNNQN